MPIEARPKTQSGNGETGGGMDRAVFWALAGVVALAPLPLGGNRAWAWCKGRRQNVPDGGVNVYQSGYEKRA